MTLLRRCHLGHLAPAVLSALALFLIPESALAHTLTLDVCIITP